MREEEKRGPQKQVVAPCTFGCLCVFYLVHRISTYNSDIASVQICILHILHVSKFGAEELADIVVSTFRYIPEVFPAYLFVLSLLPRLVEMSPESCCTILERYV